MTLEEAAQHVGERVIWRGLAHDRVTELTEEGTIYHTSANFVFVRRPHDLNGASASGASQIELIATEGRLF